MKDQALIEDFESCKLNPETFRHQDHVRLAWSYLCDLDLPEAMIKVRDGLKKFTTFLGKSDRYHETVTFAYLMLVNERMKGSNKTKNWETFFSQNHDLFVRGPSILDRFYTEDGLNSNFAKQTFLWPNKT